VFNVDFLVGMGLQAGKWLLTTSFPPSEPHVN
jgi:hypothetical protein